jgi:hypothetical protein
MDDAVQDGGPCHAGTPLWFLATGLLTGPELWANPSAAVIANVSRERGIDVGIADHKFHALRYATSFTQLSP